MSRIILFAPVILSLLTACTTGVSNDTQSYCLVLPNVKKYSQQQMDAVAKEVGQVTSPQSTELLKDYKVMRDQTRIAKQRICENLK